MFKKSLIFDDRATATDYMAAQVSRGITPPTIFTKSGHRLTNDGLMDPGKGKGRMPDRLPFVFGQSKPDTAADMQRIDKGTPWNTPTELNFLHVVLKLFYHFLHLVKPQKY
jgi:hypothetical protein